MKNKKLTAIYLVSSLTALFMLIISMSFFGAEGFKWFGGFIGETTKARDSIAIITWSLIAVGCGLAIGGAAMQGITRNQLASAYSLGTTSAAMLAVMASTYIFTIDNLWINMLVTMLLSISISAVFLLITFSPRVNPSRVIVIGMIFSIFLSSITYILRVKYNLTSEMITFLALDSFDATTWDKFKICVPIISVCTLVLLFLGRQIQIFEIDPEKAKTLAIKPPVLRFIVSSMVILIATTSVYLVGPIAFIGILIPHLARMILGKKASTRKIMLLAIPLAIIFLLTGQVLTRYFFRFGFTINVFISVIAGPLIIYKIVRGNYA